VAVNFADSPRPFNPPAGAWAVALASDTATPDAYTGTLGPNQAVILVPA
jgi:hypothetical protein